MGSESNEFSYSIKLNNLEKPLIIKFKNKFAKFVKL